MSDEPEGKHLPKWRATMDTGDLRRYVTRAVKCAERVMYDAYERGDEERALTAATRLQQAARTYLKVLEADELEERIERLEEWAEGQSTTNGTMIHHN